MGDIDWKRYMQALYGVSYDRVISIKYEVRGCEKGEEHARRCVLLAKS